MRIIAGELRSRRLVRPPTGVRPTSDRLRESLFTRLGDVGDARVLDLFAGTGALALEALSRGASDAVMVERAPHALDAIRTNVKQLGLGERSRILRGDASTWAGRLGRDGDRFDLIFVDPPYESDQAVKALLAIVLAGVLAEGGAVVVESAKRHALPPVDGLRPADTWLYGDTRVTRLLQSHAATGHQAEGSPPG